MQLSNCLSKAKQRKCPVGVLYTYPEYRTAIGVPIHLIISVGTEVVLYISAWALALLVSTGWAMRRPQNVKRETVQGFTFFMSIP